MPRNDRPVTLVPADEEDLREYTRDMDASEVAQTNLEEEIRQTDALSV